MLFASLDFLLFLLPVLGAYWLLSKRPAMRFALLLVCSYFFYSAGAKPPGGALPPVWYFVLLLVFSTLIDYAAGLLIGAARERGETGRGWLLLSLVTNLGILGYFKYAGFLLEIGASVARAAGLPQAAPALRIALPIGVSFYTFQSLSYTIDVWRGKLDPERSFVRFALYVAFFPQLVAGPIVRATEFLPQLRGRLVLRKEDADFALFRITKGIVKKVVLGDFIAVRFTDIVFSAPSEHSSLESLLALYAFTLQIYADFSGYSDVAIGVARLFGLRLPENFDRPYQATSIAEFWRRWHITLSTWLRDYVFFPLGGSRGGLPRTCVNLWLTMFLIGMWHGASYCFVVYANLQAAAMVVNRILTHRSGTAVKRASTSLALAVAVAAGAFALARVLDLSRFAWASAALAGAATFTTGALLTAETTRWQRAAHVLLTFHFVVLSRLFFRSESLTAASEMAAKLFEMDGLGIRPGMLRFHDLYPLLEGAPLPAFLRASALALADHGILLLIVLGFCVHFSSGRAMDRLGLRLYARAPAWSIAAALGLLGAIAPRLLAGPHPNIYFAF
jgi:D-alanyl-lipoteichoic acid acyltransferase DltB (MBOAT superfamily)